MKIYSVQKANVDMSLIQLKLEDLRKALARRKAVNPTERRINSKILEHINNAELNFLSLSDFLIEVETCPDETELKRLLREKGVLNEN